MQGDFLEYFEQHCHIVFCLCNKEIICLMQVGDFGLSKIKRNTLVTGGVRGTLPWMAPELLSGSSSKVSEKVLCNPIPYSECSCWKMKNKFI